MSKLFVIPTPIGNLEDITFRAIKILQQVDIILAEDTRVTKKLLRHYQIKKEVMPFHIHNEHKLLNRYVEIIINGKQIGLVSDAGTPAISDPGFLLIRECVRNQIEIECLPGPTAMIPALVNSSIACERFVFEGFLPLKKGREKRIKELKEEKRTIILYESPHRLLKTLSQIAYHFGPKRFASISREMTKIYEETKRGPLIDLIAYFESIKIKGEFVIVISAQSKP